MPSQAVPASLAEAGPVRLADPADAVAGVMPAYVTEPVAVEQVSAVLRAAAADQLTVVVRGSGSKLAWGAPPRSCDLLMDLRGLDRILDHAAGDMVARVQAGVPLDRLAQVVAGAGQQFAVDPPAYDEPAGLGAGTVGGALAVAAGGPRRLRYGSPRDLLLGVTVVRADGVVASAGGRVVKNVAGYDLGKLLCGSYGTLAVIVAATLRLHPVPAVSRFLTVELPDPAVAAATQALLASQSAPSAVELAWSGPAAPVRVAVLFEGTRAGVAARVADAVALVGGEVSDTAPGWFGRWPGSPTGTLVEVRVPPAALAGGLAVIAGAVAATGLVGQVRGSAGVAELTLGLGEDASPARVARLLAMSRAGLAAVGGTAVLRHAPSAVHAAVDSWGPVHPGTLALMRRVKAEFDPEHRLAPGRFVGGI